MPKPRNKKFALGLSDRTHNVEKPSIRVQHRDVKFSDLLATAKAHKPAPVQFAIGRP